MIQPNELRIGNLVYVPFVGQVESIEDDSCYINPRPYEDINQSRPQEQQTTYDMIKPIPLTEEWLLKLGLRANSDKSIFVLIERPQWEDITIRFYDGKFSVWIGDAPMMDIEIKYVHQLQNLYFALKGEELLKNQ